MRKRRLIALNSIEMTEQLFQAIDAIIDERMRQLPYDKTIVATVVNNANAAFGKYRVTTDDNITFDAYSEVTTYPIQTKVYVRIPQNDYTKQKIITGRYVPSGATASISEVKNNDLENFKLFVKNSLNELETRISSLEEN